MIQKNLTYLEREAKTVTPNKPDRSSDPDLTPVTQPKNTDGKEKDTDQGAPRVGSIIIRWHNSDGIGSDSDRYGKKWTVAHSA